MITFLLRSFGLALFVSPVLSVNPLTTSKFNTLYNELYTFFSNGEQNNNAQTNFHALAIRLVFHDAASFNATGDGRGGMHAIMRLRCTNGQCENSFEDNRGLDGIINEFTTLHARHAADISVADFWALAGSVAVDYAVQGGTSGDPNNARVAFKWGRTDHGVENSLPGRSNAELGYAHLKETFVDRYGFTVTETVSLLGAHSLGRAHAAVSGYDGEWVQNNQRLSNDYYRELRGGNWRLRRRQSPTGQNVHQWERNNRIMLQADTCMQIPIEGRAVNSQADFRDEPRNPETSGIVNNFANNNNLFLTTFARSFAKLSELGYNCLDFPDENTCNPNPTPPGNDGGFDFGSGCPAGEGSFDLNLPQRGTHADVGIIPAGKFSVTVRLTAPEDIDITLFDMSDTSEFAEGRAIVAWCASPGCNQGVLGMSSTEGSAIYERNGIGSMNVRYSGYNGVNGQKGEEFVEISGETTTDLRMRAFAYEVGTANVEYSWGRSQTPCCLGQAACNGSFQQRINQGGAVTVGEIPEGKLKVNINLTCPDDVDIQVYDLDDTSQFAEGKAIVAWCPSPGCNMGVMSGANQESIPYPPNNPTTYVYSGYNGVDGQKGNEFIIVSETTRNLVMKAFGYASGTATVNYEWWEQA